MDHAGDFGGFWVQFPRQRPIPNSVSTERVLIIDSSSMPVAAGKATLTIGPLKRVNGVYTGNYAVKLFPYFFKNEKGTLAMWFPMSRWP